MKISIMRELIIAVDSNQISDEAAEAANVQTSSDVVKLSKDWNAAKVQAWSNPDDATADKNISDWSKGKK